MSEANYLDHWKPICSRTTCENFSDKATRYCLGCEHFTPTQAELDAQVGYREQMMARAIAEMCEYGVEGCDADSEGVNAENRCEQHNIDWCSAGVDQAESIMEDR